MSKLEMYDATRAVWKVGTRADSARFALAVYNRTIREVYSISKWLPARSTYTDRTFEEKDYDFNKRKEFVGNIAPENVRKRYIGKSVAKYFRQGTQNPIRYVNVV